MRRAFVGLSGPLAYDYHTRERFGFPNPLLEDSLGLLIFYDEIIFLAPELCPWNMRHLEYVRFLSEEPGFEEIFESVYNRAIEVYKVREDSADDRFDNPYKLYEVALCNMTGQPFRVDPRSALFLPDNHGAGLSLVDGLPTNGSSTWFRNVIVDWMIPSQFGLENCDVISNSGNKVYYNSLTRSVSERQLASSITHRLIARKLPNYLHQNGPYHSCLEELRNHSFLSEARSYIDEIVSENKHNDLEEMCDEVTRLAYKHRDEVFRRHLAGRNEYWVVCKAAVTELFGLLLPGMGFVSDIIRYNAEEQSKKRIRWAGFVTDVDELSNN